MSYSRFFQKLLDDEELGLKKDIVIEYGVAIPVLKYKGQVVFEEGRYLPNRQGFTCLSCYWNDELPYEEQLEYYNSALREIRRIDKEEEEQEKEAIALRAKIIEEKLEKKAKVNEAQKRIEQTKFKYDGSRHMMIIDGELYVNDPTLTLREENRIEVHEGNVDEIKRFLDDKWTPSEHTINKWRALGVSEECIQKILKQHE